ncbi:S-adenosyl-L-methionine-dependent methyltransferase [Aspergillus karnatakaensis]|uniref:DNA cytosine methyltransferase n=1 Tax=Aspergillus karnatakaensis TaxID=1810916 RepID=UPI003CCCA14E
MRLSDYIVLSDDDDNESDSDTSSVTLGSDSDRLSFLCGNSRTVSPFSSLPAREVIDLTNADGSHHGGFHDGDYLTDEGYKALLENWAQAAAASPPGIEAVQKKRLDEACVDGIVYVPGQSIELHDDTFLRITSVWENPDGEIYFEGRRLRLLESLEDQNGNEDGETILTYFPRWQNELVWMLDEVDDVPLGIVRHFVTIHFTNHSPMDQDPHKILYPSHLYCRLKERPGTSVEYLTFEEADVKHRIPPATLRNSWRGETTPFGSNKGVPVIDLDDIDDNPGPIVKARARRKYTFGDGFCGAGGVSCGAETAGLHIKWAFDMSPHAAVTYRLNFSTAECEESDIFSFLTNDEEFMRVDVTHGSPPCQTWSPAHTIPGPNDDANSACIFSCGDLIRKAKPRIHTVEETDGLIARHKQFFLAVIRDFIDTGYSVRWAVLNCLMYGVPQKRKRLVIIASGPGETLPTMPKPTHGLPGSGLRDLVTINQVISNIPLGAPNHDIDGATRRGARKAPFDGNGQAHTITCGGGTNNYHPSGERNFTRREAACLQTFPLSFRFGPAEISKQIGNAVPPALARAIYREVIKTLQETDERELREIGDR